MWFDLVCDVGFVFADGALADEEEYLLWCEASDVRSQWDTYSFTVEHFGHPWQILRPLTQQLLRLVRLYDK